MAICSGLRVAFAAFPEAYRSRLLNALFHLNIKTSSLDAEIMTELILSGKAAKILTEKAELARQRNKIFDGIFPDAVKPGSPEAFFRWLPLPKLPVRGMELERSLREKNVNVYSSHRFTVKSNPEDFLRLAISSPANNSDLLKALNIVKAFISNNTIY